MVPTWDLLYPVGTFWHRLGAPGQAFAEPPGLLRPMPAISLVHVHVDPGWVIKARIQWTATLVLKGLRTTAVSLLQGES